MDNERVDLAEIAKYAEAARADWQAGVKFLTELDKVIRAIDLETLARMILQKEAAMDPKCLARVVLTSIAEKLGGLVADMVLMLRKMSDKEAACAIFRYYIELDIFANFFVGATFVETLRKRLEEASRFRQKDIGMATGYIIARKVDAYTKANLPKMRPFFKAAMAL